MHAHKAFDAHLTALLADKKAQGLFRELVTVNDNVIDFCSNDYLGLASKTDLIPIENQDLKMGSTGSRLITGNSRLAEETEAIIARFHKAEAALIMCRDAMHRVSTGAIDFSPAISKTPFCQYLSHSPPSPYNCLRR